MLLAPPPWIWQRTPAIAWVNLSAAARLIDLPSSSAMRLEGTVRPFTFHSSLTICSSYQFAARDTGATSLSPARTSTAPSGGFESYDALSIVVFVLDEKQRRVALSVVPHV